MWDQGSVIGVICHIHGQRPGSARYIAQLSPTFVHSLDNLVLLCPIHHKQVDDHEDTYTADWLRQRKAEHEGRVGATPASMLSRLIEILSPDVPKNWEDRPGAPVFRLGLASSRPKQPDARWSFQIDVAQVDGTDIGGLEWRTRQGGDASDWTKARLQQSRHWNCAYNLPVTPRGDFFEFQLRFWWGGGQRLLTFHWDAEEHFQNVMITPIHENLSEQ